jgi:hypothetical protein
MERELRIHETSEVANLTSLARSRFLPDRLPQEYAATRARHAISLKAVRHSNDDLWSFVMLSDAPAVSRSSSPLISSQRTDVVLIVFLAEGDRRRRTVRPAHTLSPSGHAHGAAAAAGEGGAQEGEEDPAARALGTAGRGVPTARAAGTFFPGDLEVLVVGRGGRRRERQGAGPLRGGSLRPPHQELQRRRRNRCPGWARKRPPPGGLWKRRHVPQRRRRAPRRCPGALQWRHRPPPQRPSSPRERGSGASPP